MGAPHACGMLWYIPIDRGFWGSCQFGDSSFGIALAGVAVTMVIISFISRLPVVQHAVPCYPRPVWYARSSEARLQSPSLQRAATAAAVRLGRLRLAGSVVLAIAAFPPRVRQLHSTLHSKPTSKHTSISSANPGIIAKVRNKAYHKRLLGSDRLKAADLEEEVRPDLGRELLACSKQQQRQTRVPRRALQRTPSAHDTKDSGLRAARTVC